MASKTVIVEEGELGATSEYVRKTNQEIRELALGMRSGTVFGSWMLRDYEKDLLTNVFMPLIFMNDIQHKAIVRDNIAHFYGYLKDAAPRAINGLPIFYSMFMINAEDCLRLKAAGEALEAFMKEDEA
jgi:hypothetical protein